MKNASIIWYGKRNNTVETSSFGSEFVALRIAVEIIDKLIYVYRSLVYLYSLYAA